MSQVIKSIALMTLASGMLLPSISADDPINSKTVVRRMAGAADIKPTLIKRYVKEAKALVDEGREIKPQRKKTVEVPAELKAALAGRRKARAAYDALSPGKQREYCAYIAEAKRAETKASRLDKILPMIESGSGLNDRYR